MDPAAPQKCLFAPPSAASPWNITSQPCSVEEGEAAVLASLACSSMQYACQTLSLRIKPSTDWTPEDLTSLSSLVKDRNRFVCMQLVTMAKEQYAKVQSATAAGDAAAMHAARYMFLGTVALEATGDMVSAGLFYPRFCSKDGIDAPHMYVELLCCNDPGKGYGTVLLQHIEQFVVCGCESLSAGFFGSTSEPLSGAAMDGSTLVAVGGTGSTLAGCQAVALTAAALCHAAAAAQPAAVLPLQAMDGTPVGVVTGCCSGCICSGCLSSNLDSLSLCTGSTGSTGSTFSMSSEDLISSASSAASSTAAPMLLPVLGVHTLDTLLPTPVSLQQQQQVLPLVVGYSSSSSLATSLALPTAAAATAAAASGCGLARRSHSPVKRIKGFKLLSVASAQAFYARNGYGEPDLCKEMFKPLPDNTAAGSASTSSSSNICC